LATLIALLFVSACGPDKSDSSSGSEAPSQGEVFLTPAGAPGPDPFSAAPLAPQPNPAVAQPVTEPGARVDVPKPPPATAAPAGGPGLYGGTNDNSLNNPQGVIDFLAANPDKAKAWVDALNKDPELLVPGGLPLTVEKIPAYINSLVGVILMTDTRVTNHGFVNGVANPFQAVLQKGTAVLVDAKGVPRVRGFCGNPLIRPKAVSSKVVYKGNRWADFNLTKITVIQQSTVIMRSLQVVNILTINNRVSNRVYINMPCFYQLITIWFPPPMFPGQRRVPPPTGRTYVPPPQYRTPPPQQQQPPRDGGETYRGDEDEQQQPPAEQQQPPAEQQQPPAEQQQPPAEQQQPPAEQHHPPAKRPDVPAG
jgi:hypothetical protein